MATDSLRKNVNTVMVALATAAIGWLAFSVQENNIKVAVLIEKVDRLEHRAYAQASPLDAPYAPARVPFDRRALPVSLPEPRRK